MSMQAALRRAFELYIDFELSPMYNVAPTDAAHVVIEDNGKRILEKMTFGLIPHWAKDATIALHCLNARSETIDQKPAFRTSFRKKRCLVPVDGFFEWKREGKVKSPFFFRLKSEEPFGLAGLWDEWKRPDGKSFKTFAIVTTEPNDLLKTIHDRMPVIVDREHYPLWLSPQVSDDKLLKPILKPYPSELLKMVPVSSLMNNSKNKGPECVTPLNQV